jgi:hypothetical protein
MLRKSLGRSLGQPSRGFHSTAAARRIVGTNPVKAQEVNVRGWIVWGRALLVLTL